ncbi:MAG: TonB family protein [Saprospiraceae bacterium]|nr:TonB family protein [Saprospiraceae bacterium]
MPFRLINLHRVTALLSVLLLACMLSAQDTLYFDQYYAETRRDSAWFVEIRHFDASDTNRCTVLSYYADGSLISAVKYSNFTKNEYNGRCSYWNKNQQLSQEISYKQGKRQGIHKVFYSNGQLKSAITWDQDTIVQGAFFKEDGSPKIPEYKEDMYAEAELSLPEFPGGNEALSMYLRLLLRYPPKARENNIQGTVLVSFVVEKNGDMTNVRLEQSVDPDIDKEALRVVNRMPGWKPGRIDDVPVRVLFTLPITFRLE